ncbi:MAG TPA: copper transporter [Syntrophomonadaceae bacterium]|jgi:hypothetical protein|nr:copper transporter [Syntrophomonadaceae bacterium]HRX20142.1 copper transporter [Syntrophomonadaceae bacterium]
MIDLRYHIASIVAVFLALALGILIGSTIVGDNLIVEQQKKMIDRLEEQFYEIQENEEVLTADNQRQSKIISNYENYSQTLLPPLVNGQLQGMQIGVVISGDNDLPAGMINALASAGANIVSKTVVLSGLSLHDKDVRSRVKEFYGLEENATPDIMRQYIARSVATVIQNHGDPAVIEFLQNNNLVKFSGANQTPLAGVIILGGANDYSFYFVNSFDTALIDELNANKMKVYGVEQYQAVYSYMDQYGQKEITTIDNIELSLGQISLVFAMAGEPGNYGMKSTAKKLMPTLPVESVWGQQQ